MSILFQNRVIKKYRGLIVGAGAFITNYVLSFFPKFSEKIYRNTVYQGIRTLWDTTLGRVPLLGFFLFLAIIVFYFIKNKSKPKARVFLNFVGYILFGFYLLWGFNYSALTVAQKLNLETSQEMTSDDLQAHLQKTINKAEKVREPLQKSIITEDLLPNDLGEHIRPLVKKTLNKLGYPTYGSVRCSAISSSGWMRSLGISGIYFPFALESFVDNSQTPLSKTFAMAHEMAHGYGITNEGEANFIAYLALTQSSNDLFQYIGYYELLTYEMIRLRNYDYDQFKTVEENLPYWIKEDLKNQRENAHLHQTKFPWLSNKMNDFYLKSQGIEQGTASYGSVINLVFAYEEKR